LPRIDAAHHPSPAVRRREIIIASIAAAKQKLPCREGSFRLVEWIGCSAYDVLTDIVIRHGTIYNAPIQGQGTPGGTNAPTTSSISLPAIKIL
jgi:hypothetical protein